MIRKFRRIESLATRFMGKGSLKATDDELDLIEATKAGETFNVREVFAARDLVSKWRRIDRLIKKIDDVFSVAEYLLEGNEERIREHYTNGQVTKEKLLIEAREMNVLNYGKLSKKELAIEVRKYKDGKINRQRFERKR